MKSRIPRAVSLGHSGWARDLTPYQQPAPSTRDSLRWVRARKAEQEAEQVPGWAAGGCRRELLDRTLIWNLPHLRRILRDYENHHNTHRPHMALAPPRLGSASAALRRRTSALRSSTFASMAICSSAAGVVGEQRRDVGIPGARETFAVWNGEAGGRTQVIGHALALTG